MFPEESIQFLANELVKRTPRIAEEGSSSAMINLIELSEALSYETRVEVSSVIGAFTIIKKLFISLRLIDEKEIMFDRWKWVSFPAQLLGLSLLETLADSNQYLLEKSFWETGRDRPDRAIEAQRALLKSIETARAGNHQKNQAKPIRFIYVAWALIKLDGKFLFRLREDKKRNDAKGNYVLVGGRFNQHDLKEVYQKASDLEILKQIQSADSPWVNESLENTLFREVSEEVGLNSNDDYQSNQVLKLNPYQAVEGAQSNHALTHYELTLFDVRLTNQGRLKLWSNVLAESQDTFAWFTSQEIADGKTIDGKTLFVDALRDHFDGLSKMLEWLQKLPESFKDEHYISKETESIDLPVLESEFVKQGKSGKEKELSSLELPDGSRRILLLLGWHLKACEASELTLKLQTDESIQLLPQGWIHVTDDRVASLLQNFSSYLYSKELPILENLNDEYFRLSVNPKYLYFSPELFSFTLLHENPGEWGVRISVEESILHGCFIPEQSWDIPVSEGVFKSCKRIMNYEDPEIGDIDKSFRDQIDKYTRQLGVRKFLRKDDTGYFVALNQTNI